MQVVNDTGRDLTVFYGDAPFAFSEGAYKVPDVKKQELTPRERRTSVHTGPESQTLLVKWDCPVEQRFGNGVALIFHNPAIGYPTTGSADFVGRGWLTRDRIGWAVDEFRDFGRDAGFGEFNFVWARAYGSIRLKRHGDTPDYKEFAMAIPVCP